MRCAAGKNSSSRASTGSSPKPSSRRAPGSPRRAIASRSRRRAWRTWKSSLSEVRVELVEAESLATSKREAAHARELDVNRRQQQIAFDQEQIENLRLRITSMTGELDMLSARREPARAAVVARKAAAEEAGIDGARAAEMLANESEAYESANREIEGLEADVEAARSEVFSAINAATALRHSLEHAGAAGDRVAETPVQTADRSRRCAH